MRNSKIKGGKVYQLFADQPQSEEDMIKADLLKRIEELSILVQGGKIDNLMIAGFNGDRVLTGYSNLNIAERMILLGYLQADVVTKSVIENIEGWCVG